MGRKVRIYSKVNEASDMIETLLNKHPEAFWCIKPEQVAVMGIENVERSEKAIAKQPIWSRMRNVKGVEQAIFKENNINIRYIIETFWSDWNNWRASIKAAVLSSHLFEITPDAEVKNAHDCIGFNILYKTLGINWQRDDGNGIPNLLLDDVKFDLDLRPGLEELKALEDEEGPSLQDDDI